MSSDERRLIVDERMRALDSALDSTDPLDLDWIGPLPSDDGWTLAPDALRFIGRLLPHFAHIVEFGSGLSTRLLTHEGRKRIEPPWITSIDHDPEFGVGDTEPLDYPRLRYQLAPVVARDFGGKLLPSYYVNRAKFATSDPPDLVIIDGPPNCLGGREGVLYQAMEWAKPGTLVLVDDADRRGEQAAMASWKDVLGDAIEIRHLPGFAKGLSAIVVREPVPIASLWSRRLEAARDDVRRFVAPGASVVLIDDNSFGRDFLPDRQVHSFLERDGEYWSAPRDSAHAIEELATMRERGVSVLALLWISSWWRDYYGEFIQHVAVEHRCLLSGDQATLYDLR